MPISPSYPDIVGNYYGGLDAGTDRAVKMEELNQKLQTQNALVRLNNPQTAQGFQPTNYPEVQAMQLRAEQLSKMYEPSIAAAIKTKNAPFLKGVAEVYRGSGVPALQKYADALSSAEFHDDGKYKVRYKFDTQEELDAMKQRMPSFAKNHPGVQVGIYYDFDLEGEWGSPQTKVYSAEPVKLEKKTEEKPHYDTTSIKDQADVESLMSQLDPKDPKTPWVKARLEKAIKERKPGEEIRARMEGTKPTGLFDITTLPKDPSVKEDPPMPFVPVGALGERNEAALEGLDQGKAQIVKQLVDYKIPFPSGSAQRSPYWQNILQRAVVYDPSFDATQYNTRMRLRQDFASGKSSQNIRSLNTVVAHLDTLSEKAKALRNLPFPIWNSVANIGLTSVGDKRVVGFSNAATAVESELAAVFKNMGATDQEIKQWRKNINASQSPAQIKEGVDTAIELLSGRLDALRSQYETGMGKPVDFKILSAKSESILRRLKGGGESAKEETDEVAKSAVRRPKFRFESEADFFAAGKSGKLPKGTPVIYKAKDGKYYPADWN